MIVDLKFLTEKNLERWNIAKVITVLAPVVIAASTKLIASRTRYELVEMQSSVPWWIIAVIHLRESTQDFSRSLAQGDRWDRVSTHVPKGRGPFKSWEDAAVDALCNCPPFAARWKDWSIGGALTLLEKYNGLGYANRGVPSPYLWAMTNQYVRGKYVGDGIYDPQAVDKQIGCAAILKEFPQDCFTSAERKEIA